MTPPSAYQIFKSSVGRFFHRLSPTLEYQMRKRFSKTCWENWSYRTKQVRDCPDNIHIPRVPDAGQVVNGYQIMHNGLKVLFGSYYGKGPSGLLKRNKGVHEPQEERVFQEVLKNIPCGSVMIELGAYWAFYSMWFCKEVPDARAFMVEPASENLIFGQQNFAANSFQGHFTRALVGDISRRAEDGPPPIICMDDFAAEHGLDKIAILHSDIQGFELQMLKGCTKTLPKISYLFISTHTEDLHRDCEEFLKARGFITLASISPPESYSCDGILVSRAKEAPPIAPIEVSRKSMDPRYR